MNVEIRRINFSHPESGQVLVELLDAYARDPMGGGMVWIQSSSRYLRPD